MLFAHDTEEWLAIATGLVNSRKSEVDTFATESGLAAFVRRFTFSGTFALDEAELADVRAMRERVRALWSVTDRDAAAAAINDILLATASPPYLAKHDELDWHLHVTSSRAPLAHRLGAEAAMGLLDLLRANEWDRLGFCAAEGCFGVLVDLSKNRSKRYCDGDCGNRANVAAYRARQRTVHREGH